MARLGGEADPTHMASFIRHLEPCIIPDASHMLHHEQPGVLAQAIESFLERT
jgi:pimeloyl-ACP methyl ester carboxylesterase